MTLPDGATWSFKDSWATSLTAVLTAVAAVGTAVADKFTDVVASQSVLEFGVGGAMLGVVSILAPIAYAAFSGTPSGATSRAQRVEMENGVHAPGGNLTGLLIAALLTLTGSFGSLAGILVLVIGADLSIWTKTSIWIACLLAGGLIVIYAIRTLKWVIEATKDVSEYSSETLLRLSRLGGMFSVECCGQSVERSRIRVVLL